MFLIVPWSSEVIFVVNQAQPVLNFYKSFSVQYLMISPKIGEDDATQTAANTKGWWKHGLDQLEPEQRHGSRPTIENGLCLLGFSLDVFMVRV